MNINRFYPIGSGNKEAQFSYHFLPLQLHIAFPPRQSLPRAKCCLFSFETISFLFYPFYQLAPLTSSCDTPTLPFPPPNLFSHFVNRLEERTLQTSKTVIMP